MAFLRDVYKLFRKLNCTLCMKERIQILKYSKRDPNSVINSNSEIYGACRHKPRFHRYRPNCTPLSTDDEQDSSERVITQSLTNPLPLSNPPVLCTYIPERTPLGEINLLHLTTGTDNIGEIQELSYVDV